MRHRKFEIRNFFRSQFEVWSLALIWLVISGGVGVRADDPSSGAKPPSTNATVSGSKSEGESKGSAARPLESFKLPAGAIFVIGKQLGDAVGFSPEMFVLKKEKYDALLERIEQLERLLQPGKPQPPSSCKISGQVEGDRVHFRIRYDFSTTQARSLVALGGQGAWPVAATMDDGELPLLLSPGTPGGPASEDGLWVRVEKPGSHVLTLDLEMLPETKGDDRSLTLGLPRAAITNLEQLSVPASVPEVRANASGRAPNAASELPRQPGRWVKTAAHDAEHRRLEAVPLGAAERLELMWKGPVANAGSSEPLLTAEGRRWEVRVDETSVLTEVTMILQARRGRTARWQIQLPPQAQVEVKEPLDTDERIQKIDLATKPVADASGSGGSLTIELKQASADPLRVVLQVRQSWVEGRVPIGPYFVNGAFRQWGTIRVTEPADLRVRYHLQGDINRRETPAEQPGDNYLAEFAYWSLKSPAEKAPGSESAGGLAAAPLTIEAVKGTVEMRVNHELRWTDPAKGDAARGWQAISKIQVTPNRTSLDRLEVRIPADYAYDKEVGASSNNAVIDEVIIDSSKQVAQIKLQRQSRPFTISLPAFYPVAEGSQQADLELPRPLQTLDRGGQVTATLPVPGWEFVPKEMAGRATPGEEIPPGEHEHTWLLERAPARIELAWRPFRPELEVHSVMDVTLVGSKARVQQELRIQSSQILPSSVHLQIPPPLTGLVRVAKGGKLKPDSQEVILPKPEDKVYYLILEYAFPLAPPANNQNSVSLPAIQVAEATRTENKVRVWTEPGILPVADQGTWEEMPVEIVAGKDSLPSLVVRSGNMENPLQLRLTELSGVRPASTIIARALIQVAIDDAVQIYRARFLVTQLHDHRLEVALPFSLAELNLKALVNGQRIQHQPLGDENRFQLDLEPFLSSKPLVLEFQYRIPSELLQERSLWRTKLIPPAFSSSVFVDRVRWQVAGPPSWVMLLPGRGQSWDAQWTWQGGLLTPQPALSNTDLDHWLRGSDPSETLAEPPADLAPQLVFGQASLASLPVVHISQPIWLLACSLVVVAVGLGFILAAQRSRSPGLLLATIGGIGLIALAAAILWPGITPAIVYGGEPGMVVVVIMWSAQWLIQERYRRRVVFLPSFTRLKAGSSIIRARASAPLREPTTVDAPAQPKEKPESRS
jgi:hypothetical protein